MPPIRRVVGMADEPTVRHSSSTRAGTRFGPYLLRRLLGAGGFGEVYEAEDTVMGRVVALKLLSSSYSHNTAFRERLFREARTAGRLHDPHVVPIHGCGEIDGQLYIDMRLIDGSDLQGVLNREGALAPRRAVHIVRQIASALDAAHAEGVIHRDVKPGNILLNRNDFACLVDFGLANAATDTKLTSEGTTIGSFAYLAPERLTAGQPSPAADVYALTCVLHECLTGTTPFGDRQEIPALVAAHLTVPPPRPSQQRPGVPSGFDDVIARGMAKDPGNRFRSAGELAHAAQQALNTSVPERISDVPYSGSAHSWNQPQPQLPPSAPGRPRSRRHKVFVLSATALVVGIAAALVIVGIGHRPSQHSGGATTTPSRTTNTPPAQALPPLKATTLALTTAGFSDDLAVDGSGTAYVLDLERVLKLAPGASGPTELSLPQVPHPEAVGADPVGNVYLVNRLPTGDREVWKLAVNAATPTLLPFGKSDARKVTADATGNVYIADLSGVRKLASGATAPIQLPFTEGTTRGLAVDSQGNVYLAQSGGVLKLAAGASTATQLPFDKLGDVEGVAVDSRGNVYVIDNPNNTGLLIKLAAGAPISTQLFAAAPRGFRGLAVDGAGNLYFTEGERLLKVAVS